MRISTKSNLWQLWYLSIVIVLLSIPVFGQLGINEVGSFEQTDVSYWNKGSEPGGSVLTWANDDSFVLSKSLKITKEATTEAAYWESDNMCDNWTPMLAKDTEHNLGAFVKTDGINTSPANADEKWQIIYTYLNEAGELIGEVELDVEPSADWTELSSTVTLPEDAYSVYIKLQGGINATGTVWADAFMWPASWNRTLELPDGWFNWFPWDGDAVGHGYDNTRITDEEAYHGKYSLKFDNLPGTHDAFVGTDRFSIGGSGLAKSNGSGMSELSNVNIGDIIRISVWIKAENLQPDSVAAIGDQATVAITPILHDTDDNNGGWGQFWATDAPLYFPPVTEFDWTQFYMDVEVLEGTKSISIRLHPLGRFMGTVYMDQLEVKVIQKATDVDEEGGIPNSFDLSQNYPNPFNPTTTISYALPERGLVSIKIYDVLGREVATLVNRNIEAGVHKVSWNGKNEHGVKVSTGAYIYRIISGDFVQSKKMLLLK